MEILECAGAWTLTDGESGQTYAAQVPGCVHTDLLAAGAIPDPWYRDNEKRIHWVCQRAWEYEREIEVPASLLGHARVVLRCEGLDTLATVRINGREVLRADNMFRTWEVDVKPFLAEGSNRIAVRFDSTIPYMRERDAECRVPGWNIYHEDFYGRSYIRKMACAYGWDWGLVAPTAGIWRPMRLEGRDGAIADLRIRQEHGPGGVALEIEAAIEGEGDRVRVVLAREGGPEQVVEAEVRDGAAHLRIAVEDPALWWPNGMGDQPLYHLSVVLCAGARELDARERRIGLRTIELVRRPDSFGESFRFRVNGRDIFSKGANWIPCDLFPSRIPDATYRDLLTAAAASGMNMIRVWGGGFYEEERFYDLCDALGLLVWQDFMFACAAYPSFDRGFMENVRAEAMDNIRRLRHRACLALWCGNNEIEQGLVKWVDNGWDDRAMPEGDYKRLFDELLPGLVCELDGATPYWPCSPHTPGSNRKEFNDPTRGDAHAWSVWFGGEPIEAQRNWTFRFMSEFGFQSFPELRTVESFSEPEDRSLTSWVMDYHQRSGMGNQTIFKYLLDWFCPPKDLESSLWLTQLTQALCIQYAADHARRIQGRMDGLLYWQLNDLWPGATWSSIDVFGRWKALQFFARRFFEPVHVSLLESLKDSTVEVHISNHRPGRAEVTLEWALFDLDGARLAEGSAPVTVASQSNVKAMTLDCGVHRHRGGSAPLPGPIQHGVLTPIEGDRDLLVFARVLEGGVEISREIATFARPKHLRLRPPTIVIEPEDLGNHRWRFVLTTDVPSPWVRLDLGEIEARPSDNFFHLVPGVPLAVEATLPAGVSRETVRGAVRAVPLASYWTD